MALRKQDSLIMQNYCLQNLALFDLLLYSFIDDFMAKRILTFDANIRIHQE